MTDSLERVVCATARRSSSANVFTRFETDWVTWGSEAMGPG